MRKQMALLLSFFVLLAGGAIGMDAMASTENTTTAYLKSESASSADTVQIKAPLGSDIVQIVAFYNQYANMVKSAEYVTIQKHDKSDSVMEIPTLLRLLAKDQLEKQLRDQLGELNMDEITSESFREGIGVQNAALRLTGFLPVSGQAYMSQLTADFIQSAACTQHEDGYRVQITLKNEYFSMEEKAGVYASCMDVGFGAEKALPNEDSSDNGHFSGPLAMNGAFKAGTINALFDLSGRLLSLTHTYQTEINISLIRMIKVSVVQNAIQEYQFTW